MVTRARLAGIELGGTKAIAVLARGRQIIEQVSWATRDPQTTLTDIHDQLLLWHRDEAVDGLGIASFGPIQLDRTAPSFGSILTTPKAGWTGARVAEVLTSGLECPWRIDTDVNGAALAEYLWGAGQGCESICYLTIGTGVGGGFVVGGECLHGAMHPEVGHLRLRRSPGDRFSGTCPFHGDCIEGLVSGPALAARFEMAAPEIPNSDGRWLHVASDLAELFGSLLLAASPKRIFLGGSVALARTSLIDEARRLVVERYGPYLPYLTPLNASQSIRVTSLGDHAGPLGSIALAAHDGTPS